jgi:hypothetical protein
MKTTQITVRNVDALLKQRVTKLAKLKAVSINDFVLETLRAKVSLDPPKRSINWLRYKGTLGPKGIDQTVLDDFETIDEKMWDT